MPSVTVGYETQVFEILKEAQGEPLSLSDIAEKLRVKGFPQRDTVAVREAVWSLLRQGKADLNPLRHVLLVGS